MRRVGGSNDVRRRRRVFPKRAPSSEAKNRKSKFASKIFKRGLYRRAGRKNGARKGESPSIRERETKNKEDRVSLRVEGRTTSAAAAASSNYPRRPRGGDSKRFKTEKQNAQARRPYHLAGWGKRRRTGESERRSRKERTKNGGAPLDSREAESRGFSFFFLFFISLKKQKKSKNQILSLFRLDGDKKSTSSTPLAESSQS